MSRSTKARSQPASSRNGRFIPSAAATRSARSTRHRARSVSCSAWAILASSSQERSWWSSGARSACVATPASVARAPRTSPISSSADATTTPASAATEAGSGVRTASARRSQPAATHASAETTASRSASQPGPDCSGAPARNGASRRTAASGCPSWTSSRACATTWAVTTQGSCVPGPTPATASRLRRARSASPRARWTHASREMRRDDAGRGRVARPPPAPAGRRGPPGGGRPGPPRPGRAAPGSPPGPRGRPASPPRSRRPGSAPARPRRGGRRTPAGSRRGRRASRRGRGGGRAARPAARPAAAGWRRRVPRRPRSLRAGAPRPAGRTPRSGGAPGARRVRRSGRSATGASTTSAASASPRASASAASSTRSVVPSTRSGSPA